MADNTNRVLTHDYLLAHVWGAEYADDVHILRATIWRLRQKVEIDPTNPVYILNEPGIGYRLVQHNPTADAAPQSAESI
jgi:two-component system KDP operon response regulator KdpE